MKKTESRGRLAQMSGRITNSFLSVIPHSVFSVPLWLVLLCTGCGQATGDVSGSVSFNGKPIVVGNIMMIGDDGRPQHGKIQRDGSYTVKEVPVGTAMVSVSSPYRRVPPRPPGAGGKNGAADKLPDSFDMTGWFSIPTKYRDPFNSGLRCVVQEGENTHHIELTGEVGRGNNRRRASR